MILLIAIIAGIIIFSVKETIVPHEDMKSFGWVFIVIFILIIAGLALSTHFD